MIIKIFDNFLLKDKFLNEIYLIFFKIYIRINEIKNLKIDI